MKKFKDEAERKEYFRVKQAERRKRKGSSTSVPVMGQADSPCPALETGNDLGGVVNRHDNPVTSGDDAPPTLAPTDALFEADKPGYYVYEKEVRKVQCHQCHRKFETRMMLLRFCSPKCQREKVASFSTVGLG